MPKCKTPQTPTIDTARARKILATVRAGASIKDSMLAGGYSEPTYYNWRDNAAKGLQPYATMMAEFAIAEAAAAVAHVQNINAQASQDWKASAWWLSRRRRNEYGDKIEVTAKTAEADELTREQLLEIAHGRNVTG